MNREKVLELARQAKLPCYFRTGEVVNVEQLERFVTLIEAELQNNQFNPDWDVVAPMLEEQQRMAKRIQELEARQQPLTDDEITLIIAECAARHEHTDHGFARAIEAAHGIGGSDDPCNFRRIKWDASAPITLNDGRIGVGTFSDPAVVRQLVEAAKRAMNYAENVVMAEGVYFDHDDDLPFIESALAAAKETGI